MKQPFAGKTKLNQMIVRQLSLVIALFVTCVVCRRDDLIAYDVIGN